MIRAAILERRAGLAARLSARARRLAEAHAVERALESRGDGREWREARLLWPLFGRD